MCVLAHPDDESLGTGGTLAKYAAEGIETYVVTATRGERGRFGDATVRPDPHIVGDTRDGELRAAARELGVREVTVLGYPDGAVDLVDPVSAQQTIADHLVRVEPDVVITFGPDGAYGHPDHIAISQLTSAAIARAADRFQVPKLYYVAWGAAKWRAYQTALKRLTSTVDGIERQASPAPDWAITTRLDTSAVWPTVWRAVQQHQTQIGTYQTLQQLSPEDHCALWGSQEFYRVYSLVNGGRTPEHDLFEGLR